MAGRAVRTGGGRRRPGRSGVELPAEAIGLGGRAGALVDALGLRCDSGPAEPIGGPGGAPFERDCPAGTVLVGLKARIGAALDAVGPVCGPARAPAAAVE
jgi:hypothetical protein